VPLRDDARTIGLVGLAHGTSHFFHLLLPPLFPVFASQFQLSYAELGWLMTLFFVVSGIGQALAGFLVDRIGARPVLLAALGCFVLSALAAASAQGYAGLALAALLAGLGNAPFHPADFTILNRRVSPARIGHAFSVHGITGNLGWAAAPLFLVGLSELTGSWRLAYLGMAVVAAGVLLLMFVWRDAIDDRARVAPAGAGSAPRASAPGAAAPAQGGPATSVSFLRLPEIWLCFSFFLFTTAALAAVQSFAGPALGQLYGLPLATTALVITVYMLVAAAGMVVGGFLVARYPDVERTVSLSVTGSALLLVVAGSGAVPGMVAVACVALAGLGSGLAGPSRDLMIKRASPPGATGRVYGTVYSGLDTGFAIGAPVFGLFMDHGLPQGVFFGAAVALAAAIGAALLIGPHLRARRAPA
jgi:FSR family fosmidomycin resistance protein-like MFS transporter